MTGGENIFLKKKILLGARNDQQKYLKGKKAGVFDGPLLNGVNMASIHASIPSIIDYWKAAPMYAECF